MSTKIETPKNIRIIVQGAIFGIGRKFCETLTDDTRRDFSDAENPDFKWHYWYTEIDAVSELHLIKPHDTRGLPKLLLIEDLIACIVLVDASVPETFFETTSIVHTLLAMWATPLIIASINLDGVWDTEALRIRLRIPTEIPIIPCVVTDKKSVANVIIALCEEVLRYWDETEIEEAETPSEI